MKKDYISIAAVLIIFALLVPATMSTRKIAGLHSAKPRKISRSTSTGKVAIIHNSKEVVPSSEKVYLEDQRKMTRKQIMKKRLRGGPGPDTVQVVAGSSLPDCSHACGSCSPCRLVMVSFVCASLAESETCPMAYKCMCRSKSYPIP